MDQDFQPIWHYVNDEGQSEGPVAFRDIDALLRTEELGLSSLVWKDGMTDWTPIGKIQEFIQSLAEEDTELALHMKPDEPIKEKPKILSEEEKKILGQKKAKRKRQQQKKKSKWYEPKVNTNLYVSGLPTDITVEKIIELFSKAGAIRLDKFTGQPKVKIYKDSQGKPKGDGLVSYAHDESVAMAISILQSKEIEPGFRLQLEPAEFKQKGDYIPRNKVNVDKLQLIKAKTLKERQSGWNEDETEAKGLRIVIIKNVFEIEEAKKSATFFEDLRIDLLREIEDNIGKVQRMRIFEHNPEGVVEIKFEKAIEAELCIQTLNGRMYAKRVLQCEFWDGKSDYRRSKEDEAEEKKRIEEFGNWLEESDSEDENQDNE
ncbi:unnamed protein product [Blepharisma stoltei]|uniref:RRM domain-containing protein n=1 Tax=Blepharisma stoltei TaxID=1481888 RepID=A0AAU9ICA0_9CILI|nr:unnamed protein product [Blepharisma stoltei]